MQMVAPLIRVLLPLYRMNIIRDKLLTLPKQAVALVAMHRVQTCLINLARKSIRRIRPFRRISWVMRKKVKLLVFVQMYKFTPEKEK